MGKSELARAVPHWEKSQETLRVQLGKKRWDDLTKLTNDITSVIAEQGGFDGAAI